MTHVSLATFLAGIGVGLAVAVPIGPMGILCIQQTLAFGLAAGLATGLAAATVQMTYGLIAVLGFGPAAIGGAAMSALAVVSAVLLFWFAYRAIRRDVTLAGPAACGPARPTRSYRDALTFGFANPLTVVLFFAAFPALTSAEDLVEAPLLVGGVFTGVAGWYLALSTAVAVLRGRVSGRALNLVNKAAGLMLAVLGSLMLANALS
ncbi:LysE family translocator [Salinarimonas soli]|nr:LysE family transporter [Salinarimonas soli]